MPAPWPESSEESEAKRPRVSDVTTGTRECRRSIQSAGGLLWSSADLALAATLLETPNARFPSVIFSNLEEKRRVFTLVYDVLRYKSVLNQALNDLYFFTRYPHLQERCHLVWLLFFDLYKRDFTLRDPLEPEVQLAFSKQGLHEIDEVLWQLRVKLAATVSRLRIKSGAHSLSKLLPRHLRLTRSALEENIITGWVNIFKTSLRETCQYLSESLGILPLPRNRDSLEPLTFKTDHLLPRFLHIMPNLRQDLVESPLLHEHHIIMQERTFCLGPAVMAQLLKDYALSGKVAQTHVNSPITMAYFANLLNNNEKIESLLVFGAGYRKEACEQYLRDLGVKNTLIYSESFSGLSAESRVLDNVIAVLATPPNTNSSVTDPVDLAVARGGDLQILQQLTDDDFASTPRGDNINKFLLDQRDTLRRAMSKPQIQFVVYETHSRFTCENEEMATTLVNDLNNYAAEVHLEELRRAQGESQERERERNQAEPTGAPEPQPPPEVPVVKVEDDLSLPAPVLSQSVVIPPSDLFELADLPDLCPNFENCLDLVAEGTYIAVIKRKEITRLDPKYMIQMAEARGLFGRPEGTPKPKSSGQTARAKAALAALQARSEMMADKSKTKVKVEMERIAAPTRASLLRDIRPPSARDCPRHTHHLAHDGTPAYFHHIPIERKSFLTIPEEEELIRRLYTCPRVHLYPPKLYEDLPSLKFWNSPASVIESYLRRKVFQRRLQLAYEFNQNKDLTMEMEEYEVGETPEQLTRAMMQLSEDINYFEEISSEQTKRELHQIEKEAARNMIDNQNKGFWNNIFPEESSSTPIDRGLHLKQTSIESKIRKSFLDHIKQRYFDFQDFYRLKNMKKEEGKPLALTLEIPFNQNDIQTPGTILDRNNLGVSFYDENYFKDQANKGKDVRRSILVKSKSYQPTKTYPHKESIVSTGRLPKVRYSSLDHLNKFTEQDFKDLYDVQDKSPPPTLSPPFARKSSFNRGTLVTLRDSLVLTQERLSKIVNVDVTKSYEKLHTSYVSLGSHRDSYSLTTKKWAEKLKVEDQNRQNLTTSSSLSGRKPSTIVGHQDSFELSFKRLASKERSINEAINCDICNNQRKSIQFTCSLHALLLNKKSSKKEVFSDQKTLSHKDSVEILRTLTIKENKQSTGCQTEQEEGFCKNFTAETKSVSVKKGSHKSKINEKPTKDKGLINTNDAPKLDSYLMKSIQISQVKMVND